MAKPRKLWSQLSPDYRKRLKANGVTPAKFNSGKANLKAARGHSKTPEHPREALKKPQAFPEYLEKQRLRDEARERALRAIPQPIREPLQGFGPRFLDPQAIRDENHKDQQNTIIFHPMPGGNTSDPLIKVEVFHSQLGRGTAHSVSEYWITQKQMVGASILARQAGYFVDYYHSLKMAEAG